MPATDLELWKESVIKQRTRLREKFESELDGIKYEYEWMKSQVEVQQDDINRYGILWQFLLEISPGIFTAESCERFLKTQKESWETRLLAEVRSWNEYEESYAKRFRPDGSLNEEDCDEGLPVTKKQKTLTEEELEAMII